MILHLDYCMNIVRVQIHFFIGQSVIILTNKLNKLGIMKQLISMTQKLQNIVHKSSFKQTQIISIYKFFFLIRLLHLLNPDIVQTWLVHADFVGGIAARLASIKKIIWNVRYSDLKLGKAKLTTIIIIKIFNGQKNS